MIEVKKLTKTYGPNRGISDISFNVQAGEILGFLGPNGAGKSTTMKILTGSIPATSGTARVCGFDMKEAPLAAKQNMGYLPETPPVYMDMTVGKYLDFCGQLRGMDSQKIKQRTGFVAERCALSPVLGRLIGNLSKGYRQRVGIAQAILHDPQVIILDEPTVGLDPNQIIEIRKLIQDLSGEHTVVLSTHILPEVQATCKRVIIINEGKIVAAGSLDELEGKLSKTTKMHMTVLGLGSETLQKLRQITGVTKVEDPHGSSDGGMFRFGIELEPTNEARSAISTILVNDQCGLIEMKAEHLSLEDLFVRLTTRGGH